MVISLKMKKNRDNNKNNIFEDAGKFAGKLGALLVEMPDGRRFRIGTGFSDVQRAVPPPLGSIVTYRYRGMTARGLPRFASFLRIREAF